MRTATWHLGLVLLCSLVPRGAGAQTPDPVAEARMRFGPVGVTPSIALRGLGVDGNVFNDVEDPRSDFTFTVAPVADAWLRAGRSRTHATGSLDFVYFHTYASERSIDGSIAGKFSVPGNRLTPWLSGSLVSTRQRVGYEIDLRSRRVSQDVQLGTDIRIGGQTSLAVSVLRADIAYDADAFFRGSGLRELLNRRSTGARVEYRQALTPLTTFVVGTEVVRDRFEFTADRDSNMLRLQFGVDLDEHALIAGRVRIGYGSLDGIGADVPDYRGLVALATAAMTVSGRTRIQVSADRNVIYSYELVYPYYVQTGANVVVTPQLTEVWDVQGRFGDHWLGYRTLDPSAIPRTERAIIIGAGVGYRMGRDLRIGFNLDQERRASPLQDRDYRAYKVSTSVTYGR